MKVVCNHDKIKTLFESWWVMEEVGGRISGKTRRNNGRGTVK